MSASLSFCQGETVLVRGSIQYVGGGPYNITGCTLVWMLTQKRGTPSLLTKSTTAATLTIISGVAGTFEFEITSTQSNALLAGIYNHEMHIKTPTNKEGYASFSYKKRMGESEFDSQVYSVLR